ncbi:MAG: FAD-dependent oxidoreductase, partial [Dokdonella sp.]
MARTALVDLLRRAAAISTVARQSGEPLDEAIERDLALRTDASRRRFLRQSISASAALMLGACAPTRLMRTDNLDDVIVVGAGVAGLTAAWR